MEGKQAAIDRKYLERKYDKFSVQQALLYCEEMEIIKNVYDGIYEKKMKKSYTDYKIQEQILCLTNSFRAVELCKKWKNYDIDIIHAVIKKLLAFSE